MKGRTMFVLLFVSIIVAPVAWAADEPSVDSIVDRYLAAIQNRDWKTMASLLTDASSYRDFTAAALGDPIDLVGAEAIVGFWRESAEASGIRGLRYETVKRFTSGPAAVVEVVAHIRARADAWGIAGGGEIEITVPLVIFVHVDGDLVVHHHDHVDYPAMMDAVGRLRTERGALLPDRAENGNKG